MYNALLVELVYTQDLKSCAARLSGSSPGEGTINAPVVKLVDTLDLGSSALRRGGSSPSRRTK